MTLAQIERRLASLERKFAAIASHGSRSASTDMNAWIDEIHGTFKDDEMYRKASSLGRKWRKTQGPPSSRAKGRG
jgi:hypothetical protein